MRFIIILLIFIPVSLFSQSFPYSTILSEKAVNTIENISASIVSDSFSPMTHYSEGDMTLSAVPSWFRVTRLSDDIEMNENDLSGRAFGIGGGSALSDDLLLYCIVSGMKIDGDLEYSVYNGNSGIIKSSVDYSFASVMGGCGYDLISNDIFSIPVYFGAQVQYYKAELAFDPITWNDFFSYTVDMKTSGDAFLYGVSGGIAISAKIFSKIHITPYFLYIHNFNGGDLNSDVAVINTAYPLLSSRSDVKVKG